MFNPYRFQDLDGGASGNAISDPIVSTNTSTDSFFIVVAACVRHLIVVADMDCILSAQLIFATRNKTYFQDDLAQYHGDPRSRERRRQAWP